MAGRERLRALNISEERVLAGRVAGLMYVVGAATGALLLLLPGVPTEHWRVTVAASFLALVWGWLVLAVIDWNRVLPAVTHLSCGFGYPLVAILAATTGGLHSPAEFFLFFTIFYVAYFYPLREALPHLLACLVVEMLPFLYDSRAVSDGLIGEVWCWRRSTRSWAGSSLGQAAAGAAARRRARAVQARLADRAGQPPRPDDPAETSRRRASAPPTRSGSCWSTSTTSRPPTRSTAIPAATASCARPRVR